ncbi:MAG: hypothetical protein ACKV2Q_16895 [Planctomycetaceae bacterium]
MAGIDVAMKHPISEFPQDWSELVGVRRGTPVHVVDSDVSTLATLADRVIEVGGATPYVLHLEPQSYFDKFLDIRMFEGNARLTKRHQQCVHTSVLLLHRSAWGKANTGSYKTQSPLGRCSTEFHYDLIKVWELPAEKLLSLGIGVLPLVPVSKVTRAEIPGLVSRMAERFHDEVSPAVAAELWTATFVLVGLRYDRVFAEAILRGVRNNMKESSTYQLIVEEGLAEGLAKGFVKARAEDILRICTKRLGKPNRKVRESILAICDEARLDKLLDRVLDVESWAELLND